MQIRPEQLRSHLARGLAPIYLVSGDEPFQVGEVLDSIRKVARKRGFTERIVLHVEPRFDWNILTRHAESLSLFAKKRILDLRMPDGKPGDMGARVLTRYAERPDPSNLLLFSTARLEVSVRKNKWFRVLEAAGVVLHVWPVAPGELPAWIRRRMEAAGLKVTPQGAAALAERVEGNMLACAQEINKLHLLYGSTVIDVKEVATAVVDSARFDVFDLVDSALEGSARRTLRIMRGLRAEGVEPTLVSWALAREIRNLAGMAQDLSHGTELAEVLRKHRVWDARKRAVGIALQRHPPANWLQFLQALARIDKVIKGATKAGDAWGELQRLGLMLCGITIFSTGA